MQIILYCVAGIPMMDVAARINGQHAMNNPHQEVHGPKYPRAFASRNSHTNQERMALGHQRKLHNWSPLHRSNCFNMFNPQTVEEYVEVMSTWSASFFTLLGFSIYNHTIFNDAMRVTDQRQEQLLKSARPTLEHLQEEMRASTGQTRKWNSEPSTKPSSARRSCRKKS